MGVSKKRSTRIAKQALGFEVFSPVFVTVRLAHSGQESGILHK
jgi:hypothetical protein